MAADLHVLYSFPTRVGTPGIGTTAWQQVRGLLNRGLKVTLCCGTSERRLDGVHELVATMRPGGFSLPYRAIGLDRAMRWHDWRVASLLRRRAQTVDIVHCWPSGSLRTLREAVRLGIPSVLERPSSHTGHVYEVVARESARIGMQLPPGHYALWNQRRLEREEAEFRLADLLLCPSEAAAQTFTARGYEPARLALHQYGYDPVEFNTAHRASRSSRPFTVLFVGECSPLKGLHVALEAWHASGVGKHGRFLICGRFVPGYREALGALLDKPGVCYRGFTSRIAEVMRESDVLVHSSFSEGSALVCYEAQACGLALLVSDAAGARCAHGVDALVHSAGDAETLTAHLQTVAFQADVFDRLQRASVDRASSLTWAHAAQRLQAIYSEQVAARRLSRSGMTLEPTHP